MIVFHFFGFQHYVDYIGKYQCKTPILRTKANYPTFRAIVGSAAHTLVDPASAGGQQILSQRRKSLDSIVL